MVAVGRTTLSSHDTMPVTPAVREESMEADVTSEEYKLTKDWKLGCFLATKSRSLPRVLRRASCSERSGYTASRAAKSLTSSTKGNKATPCQAYFLPLRSILKSMG